MAVNLRLVGLSGVNLYEVDFLGFRTVEIHQLPYAQIHVSYVFMCSGGVLPPCLDGGFLNG